MDNNTLLNNAKNCIENNRRKLSILYQRELNGENCTKVLVEVSDDFQHILDSFSILHDNLLKTLDRANNIERNT